MSGYARSADGQARRRTSHPNPTCNNARYAELIGFCTEQVNTGKKIAKNWATAKNAKTAYYAVLRYKPDEGTVPQTAVIAATDFNESSDIFWEFPTKGTSSWTARGQPIITWQKR